MELADVDLRRSPEGPAFLEALGEQQQRDCDQEDADRNSGAQRPVVRSAEKALHDVGDHRGGRAANEQWSEEVAKRQHEREGGSGEQAGYGKGKNDTQECGAAVGAQILRGFNKWAGDVLKRGVDRKKDEWRVDVREHEDNGKGTVEKKADRFAREVQILEKAVEHAIAAQDGFPGVTANEVADPQRHDHELIQ